MNLFHEELFLCGFISLIMSNILYTFLYMTPHSFIYNFLQAIYHPYIIEMGFQFSTVYTCFILQHSVNAFKSMFLYLYDIRYTMLISLQSTYYFPYETNYIFLDDR